MHDVAQAAGMASKLVRSETKLLNDLPSLMVDRTAFRFGIFRIFAVGPAAAFDL